MRFQIAPVIWIVFLALPIQALPQSGPDGEALTHLRRGAGHLQAHRAEEAIQELRKAVALDPRSAQAHMLLGQAYLLEGSIQLIAEAKGELRQALELDPRQVWARFYLARIYMDLGRNDKAKQELEQGLRTRPNIPHLLSLLGEVSRKLGDPKTSIELNRKALEVDPAMTPAHYYLGLAHLDLEEEEQAVRELESAIQSKYVIPEMYVTLGSIYLGKGELHQAAELFKKAVALDPSRPEGHLELAKAYRLLGAADSALQQLKLAAPEGKRFVDTEYYQRLRAGVLFETGRVYEDKRMAQRAIDSYEQALEIDPAHGQSHRQLAGLLLRQDNAPAALEHASKAEQLGFPVDSALLEQLHKAAGSPLKEP